MYKNEILISMEEFPKITTSNTYIVIFIFFMSFLRCQRASWVCMHSHYVFCFSHLFSVEVYGL